MIRRLPLFSPIPYICALLIPAALIRAADPKSLSDAISRLADIDPAVRDQAAKTLWQAGREAEPILTEAIKNDDPEIAARCREILIDFKYGIYPDTPQDIVSLIQSYRRGNPAQKRTAVQALTRIGPRAYAAAVHLSLAEENSALRSQVFRELAQLGARGAIGFLAEGDFKAAQQCLEVSVVDGTDRQTRAYVTFLLLRGQAEEKIAALRAEMELGDGIAGSARLLAYLLRAKGDLPGAREAAEQAHDPALLEGLLLEHGDFKTLADRHASDGEETKDAEKLGIRAAYQRLAGKTDAATRTLGTIFATPPRQANNIWPTAKALLLNDRPNQAIQLLLKYDKIPAALELLLAQQRFREALETETLPSEAAAIQRARIARTYFHLGENIKARNSLKEAINAAQFAGMDAWAAVIDAEMRMGQRDEALAHAADIFKRQMDGQGALFEKLFSKNAADAQALWPLLRAQFTEENPTATIRRLDALVAGKWPPDELSKLSDEITKGKLADLADRSALRAAINIFHKAGLSAQAQTCSRALADLSQDERDLIALATAAMNDKDWNQAAQVCGRAIDKDRSRAAPRYLRGYCLSKLGREAEGRELMDLAVLLPLADDPDRYEFAGHLQQAGLVDAAQQQYDLLTRIGDFSGWEVGNASRIMAQHASNRGDDLAAAALWERSILPCLQEHTGFLDLAAYLGVPHLIHRTRARGYLKKGNPDAALAEIKLCEEYLPGDINLPIDLAQNLRDAGREKDLIDLVNRTLKHQEEILATYPSAAMVHNSAAWLLARTRLKLNLALTHARKAAQLDPTSAAILDTLAETYFQLGQKDQAIQTIQRCIDLEPTQERHKAQLTRFQTQSAEIPPPPDSR